MLGANLEPIPGGPHDSHSRPLVDRGDLSRRLRRFLKDGSGANGFVGSRIGRTPGGD